MYIRTVKVPSSSGTVNEYVRVVESYRQDGKVKQRVIADLGRKDFLQALLPKGLHGKAHGKHGPGLLISWPRHARPLGAAVVFWGRENTQ